MKQTQPEPFWDDVLVQLQAEQDKNGHVSEPFMEQLAKASGLSLSEVFGVATFYHFIAIKPQGRYVIRVCKSLPCKMKSSEFIIDVVKEKLSIDPGESTPDGKFSIQFTNCIGACDQAPAMLLNFDLHGNLTPEKIGNILDACS
jgi:NADH:ubiquinone oxidoreductase subunit E